MEFAWNRGDPLEDISAFLEKIETHTGFLVTKMPIGRKEFERLWAKCVEANDYAPDEVDAKKGDLEGYFEIHENA